MAKLYMMQARDSVTGGMFRWTSGSPAFDGTGYTGPNAAQEIAVVAVHGEDGDGSTPTLATVLAAGASAGNTRIQSVGAPTASTDAATKGYVDGTHNAPLADIWVDGTDGDDANPGTEEEPVQNPERAAELLGALRANCTMHLVGPSLDANGFDMSWTARPRSWRAGYAITIVGESNTIVASAVVTSSGLQTVTVTGAGWTPGALSGLMLRVLDGAQAGQVRAVVDNTADTLVLSSGFAANLVGGVGFSLTRSNIICNVDGLQGAGVGARLVLRDVEMAIPVAGVANEIGGDIELQNVSLRAAGPTTHFVAFRRAAVRGFNVGWRKTGTRNYGTITLDDCTVDAYFGGGNLGTVRAYNVTSSNTSPGALIFGKGQFLLENCENLAFGCPLVQSSYGTVWGVRFVGDRPEARVIGGNISILGTLKTYDANLQVGDAGTTDELDISESGFVKIETTGDIDVNVVRVRDRGTLVAQDNLGGSTVGSWLIDGEEFIADVDWGAVGNGIQGGHGSLIVRTL